MQLIKLSLVALLTGYVAAVDEIDFDDIPNQCRSVCESVVNLSQTCDEQFDHDQAELNCICYSTNASTQIPLCEACVSSYDDDGADNDVNDLLRSCSFTRTSFVSGATTAPSQTITGPGSSGTGSVTAVTTTTTDSQGSQTTVTTTATANENNAATPTNPDGSTPTDTGNAALGLSIPAIGMMGTLFLGALGVIGLA